MRKLWFIWDVSALDGYWDVTRANDGVMHIISDSQKQCWDFCRMMRR